MFRLIPLVILLLLAPLAAQDPIPVTVLWDVEAGDTGITAELQRNGQPVSCSPAVFVSSTERSCRTALPVGLATFRLRMLNSMGAAGPWLETDATVQPGLPPGQFTITFHRWPDAPAPEPEPMAQYSDNFDRANNASLGTDWSERPGQTDFVIDTNAVLLSGAGAEGLAIYQSAVDGNDQFARITVSSMTSGAFPGLLIARGSLASTDGFCVFINSSGVELVRFDTEATLGSYSRSYSAPETVELRRVGTTISVHLDGVQRISVTSSLFSSGRYGGINGYTDAGGDSLRLDDFVLGDYPPPSGGGGFQAAWARGANVILRAGR